MTELTVDERVTELERRVAALEDRPSAPPPLPAALPVAAARPRSAREFLNEKGAKTAVDKALVIAVWLEQDGITQITTDAVAGGFEAAKEPLTGNPSDLLYQNGRRGFMAPAREKKDGAKAWYVTTAGVKFVENGLKT